MSPSVGVRSDGPADGHAGVHAAFAAAAAAHPSRPFLHVLPETAAAYRIQAGPVTYAEAAQRVEALADAWAAAGYGPGVRVGVRLGNRPDYLLTWFALNSLGASVVPINPDLRTAELAYLIAHSGMTAAVTPVDEASLLEAAAAEAGRPLALAAPGIAAAAPSTRRGGPPDADPDPARECALLYTSGTTGLPKGCVLSNAYFLEAGRWYRETGGLIALRPDGERMLTPLPLFHMNAMAYSTMAMLGVGGCLVLLDRFHPRTWWDSVRRSEATVVHYLGVMPAMLMAAPEDAADRAHHVRFGFGAGAPRDLHAPFEARFGFPLIEAWAMTETGAGAVVAASHEPRHVGTSCFGRPGPGVEARVVDETGAVAADGVPGELLVRRAGADGRAFFFDAYLGDGDATEAAWAGGWFHTGDVVRRSADGSLHFIDRRRNVIRRSGENIAAVEVEGVLARHPAVKAVAVAAVPDPVRGDEVAACVVPAEAAGQDAQAALAAELVGWCLDRLAYHKAPGWVIFVPALPLTATQKVQRGDLQALARQCVADGAATDCRFLKRRPGA